MNKSFFWVNKIKRLDKYSFHGNIGGQAKFRARKKLMNATKQLPKGLDVASVSAALKRAAVITAYGKEYGAGEIGLGN